METGSGLCPSTLNKSLRFVGELGISAAVALSFGGRRATSRKAARGRAAAGSGGKLRCFGDVQGVSGFGCFKGFSLPTLVTAALCGVVGRGGTGTCNTQELDPHGLGEPLLHHKVVLPDAVLEAGLVKLRRR